MAVTQHAATRPATPHRLRFVTAVVVAAIVIVIVIVAGRGWLSSSPTAVPQARPPLSEGRAALGEADGALPDGTSVFDDAVPGVARLDPALLTALRRAAADAAERDVRLLVDSGWRSRPYQERLFRAAVAKYGSAEQASRWVATASTSGHVSGEAVDIGGGGARGWLSRHGARYGLCQTYRNEPWHYELRPEARHSGCPRMYADAAHDPRMRR